MIDKQGDSYVNISKAGNKEAIVSILKKSDSQANNIT